MKSVISIGNRDFVSIRKNNCFYYDTELLARGIKKERIRHYGFAFRWKEVLIGTEG